MGIPRRRIKDQSFRSESFRRKDGLLPPLCKDTGGATAGAAKSQRCRSTTARSRSTTNMSFSQGTRGWPVATIAFVQTQATKVAVGIVTIENAEPTEMR